MTQTTLHKISFPLKNGVEVLFQGDDQILHVLNDYTKIFSLGMAPFSTSSERFIVTFIHDPESSKSYSLTGYHFELIRDKHIEIVFNFKKEDPDDYACMLMVFSTLLGTVAQYYGGGLIHAAFGEVDGKGFLMAAPGGTGKTTASNRLPSPFISHCDDTTLIVKDSVGVFWAHPFPTWSRFYWGGLGGNWVFENARPLHSIFFLSRSQSDSLAELTPAEKVSCCVAALEQASRLLTRNKIRNDKINTRHFDGEKPVRKEKDWFAIGNDLEQHASREIRMHWFENASQICKRLPAYRLNLSLTGNFWDLIEKCL